jgi:hypothetical protein
MHAPFISNEEGHLQRPAISAPQRTGRSLFLEFQSVHYSSALNFFSYLVTARIFLLLVHSTKMSAVSFFLSFLLFVSMAFCFENNDQQYASNEKKELSETLDK